MTIEELEVLITAKTTALKQEINRTTNKFTEFEEKADKTRNKVTSSFSKLGSAIAALGIGKIISDSITKGMDAIESDNLFETSLGNMADDVRSWSDEVANTLGLSAVAMRKNTGVIYNMTTSMGLAQDNALKMSKGITVLTEDMASFYNLDSTEAFNKLRAGLTGETEPLKALGILVDENTIKQVAYQNGIAQTGAELTQQQKVLARYVAILQQTGNAQGDLARTINSPANQLRILKNQVSQLATTFGNMLMPIISAVIPYITAFTKVITNALNTLAKFLGLSTGNSTTSGMATDIGNISSGIEDVSSGLSTADKNAKKLKGNLAGFDEMNVLQDNSSDSDGSSGGSTGVSGLDFSLGDYDAQLSGVTSKVDEIVEKINKAFSSFGNKFDFTNLLSSFTNLKKALEPITSTLFKGLKWAWDNLLVPLAQWTISDLLPGFLNAISGALKVLNPVLKSFQKLGGWLWDNFLRPIATWTGGIIVGILNGVEDALTKIGEWASANQSVIDTMVAAFATFFGLWKLTELMAFIQMGGGLIATITGMTTATLGNVAAKLADKAETIALTAMYAKDFVMSIASSTGALVKNAAQWVATTAAKIADKAATIAGTVATTAATAATWLFNTALTVLTSPITLVVAAIAALVAGIVILIKNWDTVKQVAIDVWNKIKDTWNKVAVWFDTNVIQPVKNFFVGMWNSLKNGASQAWEGIKSVFSNVSNWFKNVFTKAWTGVKNVFSTGGKIFDGIKDGIANVFKTVVNGIITGINKVIAVPFNAINGTLNKIRTISIAGIEPFKGLWKHNLLSVPQIPKLAKGGVINDPTLAMIGEAGKEAVVPLERTEWIDKLADKINSNSNGDTPIQLTVNLGDETIFNKFINYTKSKSFETNGEVFSL